METQHPSPINVPDVSAAPAVESLPEDGRAQNRFLNRELSWLDFNARVLALAERRSLPVLERTRFLAIFSGNLDEFFQVRVGGLKMQLAARVGRAAAHEDGPRKRLRMIGERVRSLIERRATIFAEHVLDLAQAGIHLVDWEQLDEDDRAQLERVFDERVEPVLTPLAVDPAHPFPYISNLSLNLAVVMRAPGELVRKIARVKVPPILPRFLTTADGERFVPLEQVIAHRLPSLFPGMEIIECSPFRVTRNTDYDIDLDDADDMVSAVESVLLRRRRSPIVVRLEIHSSMSEETKSLLMRELPLDDDDVYVVDGPLGLSGLWSIVALDRPELKLEPWTPATQARLVSPKDGPSDLFDVIRSGDVLVQHPYDSFETSVEAFIEQAARDPAVLAIKQTLYRTSSDESDIMQALIGAAGEGKQVVCVLELKARFDEEANLGWAQRLEDAGVHVTYGVVGLKTHAKLCLVVRDEPGGLRRYAHVGTGNYNPDTARMYEDVGLLTADDEVTAGVAKVFHLLTGYSRQADFGSLLVAPAGLRSALVELVRGQAREGGRIAMKLNSLVDPEVIDALYEASRAGAEIDLIVRGSCCLRPHVPGLSDTIDVRSIVGRYLEHSRIFRFGRGEDALYLIGSADLMQRNLDRRVEVLVPVRDPALQGRLDEIFDVLESDDVLAWELDGDGTWHGQNGAAALDSQATFQDLALGRARGMAAVQAVPRPTAR
jgi:polyphosphate kinase